MLTHLTLLEGVKAEDVDDSEGEARRKRPGLSSERKVRGGGWGVVPLQVKRSITVRKHCKVPEQRAVSHLVKLLKHCLVVLMPSRSCDTGRALDQLTSVRSLVFTHANHESYKPVCCFLPPNLFCVLNHLIQWSRFSTRYESKKHKT